MIRLGNPRNYWQVSKTDAVLAREAPPLRVVAVDAEPQRVTLDLSACALIVVDMQNDFCSRGGWVDFIGGDCDALMAPVEPLNRLLPALRREQVPIIWVNWGNRPDRLNLSPSILHVYNRDGEGRGIGDPLPGNGSRVLEKGSWGAAIVSGLDADPNDICVDKYRMSGFWDTPLRSILHNLSVRTVLLAGVNLDQCVMATLQDAVNCGFDAVLLRDCSATNSPSYCVDATLYNIKQCYGFVSSGEALLAALDAPERKGERMPA